ncbi:DUF6988 family protein [Pseudoduganella aquatica]|uniref:AbiV family abortive infection protein n=1 Tax=Pseudoduganella aquatica TaxID=2660641 RepID=A0A7X4KQG6_9BURK|nr:DUF5677 domain-containing protein [Pseudoduganella aquatica]MYN11232.1 hypothetical protein [Pseudoduganella aquatica]
MSLATAIEHTTKVSLWLHEQCNGAIWKYESDKQKACLALLQQTAELVDGIVILLNNRMAGPALALARPMFEGYVRSYWLSRVATEAEFQKMLRGKGPEFREIIAVIGDDEESGAAWILNNKSANWKSFNDLIHGGSEHIRRRLTETSIEPMYPEDELERLLAFASETAVRVGIEIFSVAKDHARMVAFCEGAKRLGMR